MRKGNADLELCDRFAGAFELLGKRWTGLILDLLLQRPARFCELARAVPGLSERVMAERLRELTRAGLVERQVDPGPPITATYSLTPRGEGLRPVMEAIHRWAERFSPTRQLAAARAEAAHPR